MRSGTLERRYLHCFLVSAADQSELLRWFHLSEEASAAGACETTYGEANSHDGLLKCSQHSWPSLA